jgi:hypothetical protein
MNPGSWNSIPEPGFDFKDDGKRLRPKSRSINCYSWIWNEDIVDLGNTILARDLHVT